MPITPTNTGKCIPNHISQDVFSCPQHVWNYSVQHLIQERTEKSKNAYASSLRSTTETMSGLMKKEESQLCFIQEDRQNGNVMTF